METWNTVYPGDLVEVTTTDNESVHRYVLVLTREDGANDLHTGTKNVLWLKMWWLHNNQILTETLSKNGKLPDHVKLFKTACDT